MLNSPIPVHLSSLRFTNKRWQEYTEEYTEELYKKDLHDPDNHDDGITDLELDILECEVKWALESITMNKASGTMRETQVQSLGWEDPLEKEMTTHSSTLAWKIPWTEEYGRLQSMGSKRVGHN